MSEGENNIEIKITDIKVVSISDLKINPKNRNKHPKSQIDQLVKVIEYQGFRQAIIVSNRSGMVIAGHGRIKAAKALGMKKLPASFQNFDSEEQEYACQVSDNAIQKQSILDLSGIHSDLPTLDSFDVDLLGIENFRFEPILDEKPEDEPKLTECPSCKHKFKA